MTPVCLRCGQALETGSLLVASLVHWSKESRVSFSGQTVLDGAGGLGTYGGRPVPFRAARCRNCEVCLVLGEPNCSHVLTDGWVFPYARLRWVDGDKRFVPSFLYPLSARGKDGVVAETLFAPRFPVTISGARCPARRCSTCGLLEISYGRAKAGERRPA